MSNDIKALREHLFATLADLRNKENPMDLSRAKAISDVAQTLINAAKVEVDFIEATSSKESEFFENKPDLPPGITGVHVHRMR